jgi:toxin-antitoxin system PIN domain toxin
MILPDINLLVYAYDESSPYHAAAKRWLSALLDGRQAIGFPLVSLLGFIRLTSNPKVFRNPFSTREACEIVSSWLATPQAAVTSPTGRHFEVLQQLFDATHASSSLTTNAHIAALAIEHDGTIHSNDRDFTRFPRVTCVNPL